MVPIIHPTGCHPMSLSLTFCLICEGRFWLIKDKPRILMVEDESGDAQLAEHVLRKSGFEFVFRVVDSEDAFLKGTERLPAHRHSFRSWALLL